MGKGLALLTVMGVSVACATGDPVDGSSSNGGDTTSTTGSAPIECGDQTACDGACVDLQTDPQNCGDCGRTCVVPHGTAACEAGECQLAGCNLGFADCDADPETGCELEITCEEGTACDTACGSTGGLDCSNPCGPTCSVPAESCNGEDDDCNGQCDEGGVAGCRLGVHRAYNGTNGHLFTTDLAEAQAWGLEAQNFFYLYADATADLRPFFRCPTSGSGNFFYSESNDCEMTAAPILTVGFIAPQPIDGEAATCGAVPLYRLSLPANAWHFYTISEPERASALANRWVDEGIAGYVWLAP